MARGVRSGPAGRLFLGDTDPHYHALRAYRIATNYPRIPWRDERMNYPIGADLLWPPLLDFSVASLAVAVEGRSPPLGTVERVAALLPPIFGVATVAALALLGGVLFGGGPWLAAALLLALLPLHAEFTAVGCADKHAGEALLMTLVMLAFVASWRGAVGLARRLPPVAALGVLLALSFWNWQGSALYLVLLCAFVGAWHLVERDGARARRIEEALAIGAATGAFLLALSIGSGADRGHCRP